MNEIKHDDMIADIIKELLIMKDMSTIASRQVL